ncbi:MAG: nucleoside kinase [Candidatus Hydrothermota bacterium]|nr:MAG: nucleoside kinase [Candidatus Hydrothermae bacterium]
MQGVIKVKILGYGDIEVPSASNLLDILQRTDIKSKFPIIAAHVDNKLVSLRYRLLSDATVKFIDLQHPDGQRVYERSLEFLLTYAAQHVLPDTRILVLHSYRNGIYCEADRDEPLTEQEVKAIEDEMHRLIKMDIPIYVQAIDVETGIKIFESMGSRDDAVRLLRYMPEHQRLYLYRINNFIDYSFIPMAPTTGLLSRFHLTHYPPGMVLVLPEKLDVSKLLPLKKQPKLFMTFAESARWARILGVHDAGSLNRVISSGDVSEFIKISEALHEKRIAQIADEITKEYDRIKVVLISGPSSSGKTTFTKRLAIQLRVNERRPVLISLDDYFLNREDTPIGEDGKPDFDTVYALDIDLFNSHLKALLDGKEVELPKFDFKLGRRFKSGRKLRLHPGEIVMVEGIHALNPLLSQVVPQEVKYRIYVSALTQIAIDAHNRISTSDTRLIRRLVRDYLFRGHTALDTLRMWPNVRKNEEKHIFPYQGQADTMFNSALIYELAVLKLYAEPLLATVTPDVPEYADAVRLITLLSHFLGMMPDEVPPTSILREFIGGSSFKY